MKRTPKWLAIEEMMRPGRLTRDGMLGNDSRAIEEILEADNKRVASLGVTHADIAQRLRDLTAVAKSRLGDPVVVEETLELRIEEARGSIPCPFKHPGRARKAVVYCTHLPSGQELVWTELGIHMIEAHGFYEGHGSPYRLEPERAVKLLGIKPAEKGDT